MAAGMMGTAARCPDPVEGPARSTEGTDGEGGVRWGHGRSDGVTGGQMGSGRSGGVRGGQ